MRRLWLVGVIIGGILTYTGVNEVWLALQSRTQIQMSLAEYVRTRPSGRWVKLSGCRVGYGGMVYASSTRRGTTTLRDVSVPVYGDYDTRQPVAVVLCVADSREPFVVAKFRTMGTPTETIEGVIRGGPFYSGMSRKLQDLAPWKLASDYVIVDEGKKPNMSAALKMLGIGVGMLGFVAVMTVRRFSPMNTLSATRQ